MYPFCFTFPFVAVIGVLVPIGAIAARSFAFLGYGAIVCTILTYASIKNLREYRQGRAEKNSTLLSLLVTVWLFYAVLFGPMLLTSTALRVAFGLPTAGMTGFYVWSLIAGPAVPSVEEQQKRQE